MSDLERPNQNIGHLSPGELAEISVSKEAEVRENPAIQFSVSRYVLTLGVFVAVVIFGLVAAIGLGVDLLPKFDIPIVAVTTAYPGATPEDIDKQVTRKIEDAVSTITGVADITSSSSNGISQVAISFGNGVNTASAANDVSQKVSSIRSQLPNDATAPNVQRFNPNDLPIIRVAVSGGGASLREVFDYADRTLRNKLERVTGVADISLSGAPAREIQVLLDPAKLASYNLSPARVANALRASALDLPAGDITANGTNVSFATRNVPTSLRQIEQFLVDPTNGTRVVDLGVVRDSAASTTSYARFNGQPVVLLAIRKVSGSNTVAVAAGVREALAKATLPAGYKAQISSDTSTSISASVNDTLKEGVLVAGIVAIVCLIALGKLNTAFAVVLAIPISLSAAPLVFGFFGFTFNIITLLAMIVAMGIVVDDSIVVAENIERYRHMGYGLIESVLKGASEVFSAVAAATFSLLAVLIPLALIPGILGQFFKEFALGLAGAILFSWLEALFFLTVRMAYTPDPATMSWPDFGRALVSVPRSFRWAWKAWCTPLGITGLVLLALGQIVPLVIKLRAAAPAVKTAAAGPSPIVSIAIIVASILLYPIILTALYHLVVVLLGLLNALGNWLYQITDAGLNALRRGYSRALRRSLRFNGWVLVGAGLFFLSIVPAFSKVSFVFSPKEDSSQATIRLTLPPGTALEETDRMVRRVEAYLGKRPEVRKVATIVGTTSSFNSSGIEPRNATLALDLAPKGQRLTSFELLPLYTDEIKKLFADRPEINVQVQGAQNGPGDSADLSLSLSAATQSALEERAPAVIAAIRKNPNVTAVSASISQTSLEQSFVPDESKLEGTGLTPDDLAQAIRTANQGTKSGSFRDGDETYDIKVKFDPAQISGQQSLLDLPVYSQTLGTNLPLSELGSFELRQAPSTISRLSKTYNATLNVSLKKGVNGFAARGPIEKSLKDQGLVGDQVQIGSGSSTGSAALLGNLFLYGPIAIVVALLLNYLVLGSQFNSFRYPVYLLLPVPLAVVGAIWALALLGVSLDIITVLGMVVLVGLVTKNAILLLDFVVERARAMPLADALVEAAGLRLRPIIMTTLTVLVISIPLILGNGEGAEFRKGLGVVILGGVLTSTILTLFVVPSAFYRFERHRIQPRAKREGSTTPDATLAPSATD
jgi:hydrophobic/amphiphilic exporter-1 (mainly G- bacteria), HAE1 family